MALFELLLEFSQLGGLLHQVLVLALQPRPVHLNMEFYNVTSEEEGVG